MTNLTEKNPSAIFSKKKLWLMITIVFLCSISIIYLCISIKNSSHFFSKIPSTNQFLTPHQAQKHLYDHQLVTAQLLRQNQSADALPLFLNLEIVKTNASIAQGLSDREEIGADGMLFLFSSITTPTFWMKNMHFNLDLIWLNESGEIVGFAANLPAPHSQTPSSQLPLYLAPQPVSAVLEIPAGQIQALNLQTGDQLLLAIP